MPKPSPSTKLVNAKLKIGLVLDDSLDSPDGVQQYVLAVGMWLSSQGHDVHYLVGETRRTDIPQVHSLSRNLKVRFNGNHMSMPLPARQRRLRQLLQNEQFDILHIQMPYSPFLAGRIIKATPTKTAIVGTFHVAPYSRLAVLGNHILFPLVKRTLRRFDEVVSVSPIAQQFAQRVFHIKTAVVPNTVDLTAYRAAKPFEQFADTTTIVFLGRLMERKGCLYLLQAIDYIQKQALASQPYRVVVCGKGPLQASLEAYTKEHNLQQLVQFTGFVSEADKPRYLASSDVAIFPSTAGESFGIVLVEAMAASRGVVLAGDNPGYAGVLRPFADALIDPHDTKQFAIQLVTWLEKVQDRHLRSQKQKITAEQYDVNQVGRRLLNHYRTALHRRPR